MTTPVGQVGSDLPFLIGIVEEETEDRNADLWTEEPVKPKRKYGETWTEVHTVPEPAAGSGWTEYIEHVAHLTGEGTLSADTLSLYPDGTGSFFATGTFDPTLTIVNNRTMAQTASGTLAAQLFQIVSINGAFTATGEYRAAELNDGLTAIVQAGIGAFFSGGGELVPDVEGGTTVTDGLGATLFEKYPVTAGMTGLGTLYGTPGAAFLILGPFTGDGTLSTAISQVYAISALLTGSGALSAVLNEVYATSASLSGSGTLSASAVDAGAPSAGVPYPSTTLYPSTGLFPAESVAGTYPSTSSYPSTTTYPAS